MKTEDFIVKYRWLVIAFFLAVTVFMGLQIPRATVDPDMKNMLPKNMASRISTDKIEDIFGGTDAIMVLFQTDDVLNTVTLKRIQKISKEMNRLKGIDQVMSPFDSKKIKGENGTMIVEPAIAAIPENKEQTEALREELKTNKMVYETVISKDFTVAAIMGMMDSKTDGAPVLDAIQKILIKYPGNEKVELGGQVVIRTRLKEDISKDMIKLLPVSLLLILTILFICFKQKRGALLPFGVVVMSIVFGMGMLPILGWKIATITSLLPIMIIAIANNYGIYFINRYQELNTHGNNLTKQQISKLIYRSLHKPVLMTGIVAIVGILGLVWHIMVPAKQLGVLAALSIAYALVASLYFIPAVLSLLKKPEPKVKTDKSGNPKQSSLLSRVAVTIAANPKKFLVGFLLAFIVCLIGASRMTADADTINMFAKNHPVRVCTNLINKYFGGAQTIDVLVEGDAKDPALLNRLDHYQKEMEKMPEVGKTSSMATVIKEMSKALNDKGEAGYDKIPDTRDGVAQYLELYSMSGDPKDFEKVVNFNYDKSRMVISIKDGSSASLTRVKSTFKSLVAGDTAITAIGGMALVSAEMLDAIVAGQVESLLFAIIAITLLLMFLFRSPVAGLIGALPVAFTLALLFGVMGFAGIPVDAVVAMLSSIVIGLGVDFTIHFLWKYKEERHLGLDYKEAVLKTITTRGRGILFNALAVMIGFSALFISSFPPLKTFGFLITMSIFGCLLGSLVLVPVICLVFKPKFLEPKVVK